MKTIKKLTIFVILACFSSIAFGNVPISESHTITSKFLKEEQKLTVYIPDDYGDRPKHGYPVMYMLDGKYYKNSAQGIISGLYDNWVMPDTILVTIDNEDRIRDYTPSPHETYEGATGGAEPFLDYIEQELIPFVESRYRTRDFRVLVGHSLGGLFSLHTLHSRPGLFTAHFALSPSLHWGDKETVKKLKTYLSSKTELKQFLYMNLGDEGINAANDNSQFMREGFLEFRDFLNKSAPKSFRVKAEHLETQPHAATNIIGIVNGTRELYRNWSVPFGVMDAGREGISQHFERLSQDLYYDILPRKGSVDFAAEYLIHGQNEVDKGMDLLKYNQELYPDSAWVNLNLAKGYQHISNNILAKKYAQKALKLEEQGSDFNKTIIEFLNSLNG